MRSNRVKAIARPANLFTRPGADCRGFRYCFSQMLAATVSRNEFDSGGVVRLAMLLHFPVPGTAIQCPMLSQDNPRTRSAVVLVLRKRDRLA